MRMRVMTVVCGCDGLILRSLNECSATYTSSAFTRNFSFNHIFYTRAKLKLQLKVYIYVH